MPVGILDSSSRAEPIPGFGFAVQIGENIKGWFTECSGLTIEREVKTYSEGGVNDYEHQLPGRIKKSNITLKHGLAGNELWDWFQKGIYDGQVERRNVSIVLYDATLNEIKRWDLINVYPSKWDGPSFNSSNNDVLVETIEFAHVGSGDEASAGTIQRMLGEEKSFQETPEIDITTLANTVYHLLRQELRLERERSGWNR